MRKRQFSSAIRSCYSLPAARWLWRSSSGVHTLPHTLLHLGILNKRKDYFPVIKPNVSQFGWRSGWAGSTVTDTLKGPRSWPQMLDWACWVLLLGCFQSKYPALTQYFGCWPDPAAGGRLRPSIAIFCHITFKYMHWNLWKINSQITSNTWCGTEIFSAFIPTCNNIYNKTML